MNPWRGADISYFPGCSLATTAMESNLSLMKATSLLNLNLMELTDWNCCGTSSAGSLSKDLSFNLSARNLSLAPKGRPLIVMCPSCMNHLKSARHKLINNPVLQGEYQNRWGRSFDPDLRIIHLFDILDETGAEAIKKALLQNLNDLSFAPYYGCMLAGPPSLRHEKKHFGMIEKILSCLGGTGKRWSYSSRCCGTFLAAARPDIVTPLVNEIIASAMDSGAECIVTACAMCQLNLEIRCTLEKKIPTLHFSEIVAIAFGERKCRSWFTRHLVDPRPLLRNKGLIE